MYQKYSQIGCTFLWKSFCQCVKWMNVEFHQCHTFCWLQHMEKKFTYVRIRSVLSKNIYFAGRKAVLIASITHPWFRWHESQLYPFQIVWTGKKGAYKLIKWQSFKSQICIGFLLVACFYLMSVINRSCTLHIHACNIHF